MRSLIAGLLLVPLGTSARGVPLQRTDRFEVERIIESTVGCECDFGVSLAAVRGTVLAGQIGNGPSLVQRFGVDSGALVHVFAAPDPLSGGFGTSMAIHQGTLLVGDPSARATTPNSGLSHGQAFVFNLESGALLATLVSPTPYSHFPFGQAVTLLGTRAFVSDASTRSIHVFDATTGSFLDTFTGPAGDPSFGQLLAARDPDLIVGGTGAVYRLDGSTGTQLQVLRRPRDAAFPSALVATKNDILVGGARAVYRFSGATGRLVQRYHGVERPLAAGDGRLLASGPGCDESDVKTSAAYLLNARSGRKLAVLCNPYPEGLTRFAATGAIAGDRILVADTDEDINRIYVFAPRVEGRSGLVG